MKLEQVLVELVSNALDAMPSGGRLAIAGRLEQSGETPGLAVTVQDTGSGIPEQVLPSIGEPFFTTRARRYRPRRRHCTAVRGATRGPSRLDQPRRRRDHREDLAAPMNGSHRSSSLTTSATSRAR